MAPFKVVITGVECSGKTTLARHLAELFQTQFIPEYARQYLEGLNRPYRQEDLVIIAQHQLYLHRKAEITSDQIVICDTGMMVMKMWSVIKYGMVSEELEKIISQDTPDLYILPDYNIPFELDGLRESGGRRQPIHKRYKDALECSDVSWIEVRGSEIERAEQAFLAISAMMPNKS